MMTVSAGTAPGRSVPLLAASRWKAGGISIVPGWMKVKNNTLLGSSQLLPTSGKDVYY